MNDESDVAARRAYWTATLERTHALMMQMQKYPIKESGEKFASLIDAAKAANVEMLFSDSKLGGKFDRIYWLRESLVPDVIAIGKAMNDRGWVMRIEDAYRTLQMQAALSLQPSVFKAIAERCAWERRTSKPDLDLVIRRAMCLVANLPVNGTHLYGCAIDISVFDRDTRKEVWRGEPYLHMSEKTPMASPFVDGASQQNRAAITAVVESRGFLHYPGEFWHYNKGDVLWHMYRGETQPARFGPVHWDPKTNSVKAFDDIQSPIHPPAEIMEAIHASAK
jgi:D-alanyl-D-alanine dipeptidase